MLNSKEAQILKQAIQDSAAEVEEMNPPPPPPPLFERPKKKPRMTGLNRRQSDGFGSSTRSAMRRSISVAPSPLSFSRAPSEAFTESSAGTPRELMSMTVGAWIRFIFSD